MSLSIHRRGGGLGRPRGGISPEVLVTPGDHADLRSLTTQDLGGLPLRDIVRARGRAA